MAGIDVMMDAAWLITAGVVDTAVTAPVVIAGVTVVVGVVGAGVLLDTPVQPAINTAKQTKSRNIIDFCISFFLDY